MDNSQPSSGCQLPTEVAIGDHGGGGAGAVASGDNANVSSAEGPSILQPAETWAGNGRRPLVFDKVGRENFCHLLERFEKTILVVVVLDGVEKVDKSGT